LAAKSLVMQRHGLLQRPMDSAMAWFELPATTATFSVTVTVPVYTQQLKYST